jgi:hypothetical protein
MNGKGASSSNWSSSAQKTQISGYLIVDLEYLEIITSWSYRRNFSKGINIKQNWTQIIAS